MIIAPQYIGTVARAWMDTAREQFVDSWEKMLLMNCRYLEHYPNKEIFYTKGEVSWHTAMRNGIAKKVQGDWLFMVDTDHMFAPDLLIRLLALAEKYQCKVINAPYTYKHPPHAPVATVQAPDDPNFHPVQMTNWDPSKELQQVLTVGGGAMLIMREVLEAIKATGEEPFEQIGSLSEDYSFCKRCWDLKIPVWLATNVECHHLVTQALRLRGAPVLNQPAG